MAGINVATITEERGEIRESETVSEREYEKIEERRASVVING